MYIGVDIGGTKCAVTKAASDGTLLQKVAFPTAGREETLAKLLHQVRELGPAEAIGISCGGPLDSRRGLILSPPNLPGWDRVDIVAQLEAATGIKAYLQNDANACALAEWRYGAGVGTEHMVFLTFGTGLGAGLILNGRLYAGANGNAGEVGHLRMASHGPVGYGKRGSLEGFCSGGGLAQLGRTKALELLQQGKTPSFCPTYQDLPGITAKLLAQCARQGQADALEVYGLCGAYLGRGLAALVDLLNPQLIVLGSIYSRAEALLKDAMWEVLQQECLPQSLRATRIVPAKLGEQLGDYAAIAVAAAGGNGLC